MPAMRRIGGAFELPNGSVQSSTPLRVDHALGHPGSVAAWLPGVAFAGLLRLRSTGQLRDVVLCHCTECRRWAGHAWAASAAPFDERRVHGGPWASVDRQPGLSVHDARRGFCGECGSSLFWQVPGERRR